jgi:hypothetical protein
MNIETHLLLLGYIVIAIAFYLAMRFAYADDTGGYQDGY